MIRMNMWRVLTRKKKYAASIGESSPLARVLTTVDLTALGIGSTLGVGVYVIAGQVARQTAGPAVVVSFLIAAVASILSGLCYAEFGSRIPRAGSAYIYSYVTVGELVAFIVGWNLILEYVIGAASVAKGISLYIDSLAEDILKTTFKDVAPINTTMMAEYFDFFAFGLAVLLSVALAFGLKESTKINNFATVLNLCVVLLIIIAGAIRSDINNWRIPANATVPEIGKGGFLPFGVSGMLQGAATCFYAFVGFDCIATTAEEVKNPKRAVPFAIIASQVTIFIAYFSTSTVLTLMVAYYKQDVNAPFPHAFEEVEWAKWAVAIGGICGLFTSLFGSMVPLPRILYALASDGLIFKFLGKINTTFSTPMVGTLVAGLITGLMAALFDLSHLVNMMSIGTLLAYTLVSTCVLILRYRDVYLYDDHPSSRKSSKASQLTNKEKKSFIGKVSDGFGYIFNTYGYKKPTKQSQKISLFYILTYCALAFIMALLLFFLYSHLLDGRLYMIILISVIGGLMILFLFLLWFQPNSGEALSFKVPFVPLIPALSVLINMYLMLMLDSQTWIRFGVWMFIGIPIYLICVRKSCKTPPSKTHSPPSTPLAPRGLANGHANSAFVLDENSSCPSEEKSPSEDSGIARSMENIQADVLYEDEKVLKGEEEVGIAKEDERVVKLGRGSITSIEDALATLDEVITYEEDNNDLMDRKMSVGNVSSASSAKLVKEVVLVHREDVRSIPTTPISEIPSTPHILAEEEISDVEVSEDNDKGSYDQSPRPSLILSDFDDEETDTDTLEIETFSIPPAPSMEGFEKYKVPLIPRISLNRPESDPLPLVEDEPSDNNIPPPPPPSLDDFEKYKASSTPKTNNLPPMTPPRDYYRETSIFRKTSVGEPDDQPEDNIKFGGKHHQIIKEKLSKMLMQTVAQVPQTKLTKPKDYPVEEAMGGSKTLKPVMSKVISEILVSNKDDSSADGGNKELVDDTPQTPGDIRNRLDALFRSTRVNPMSSIPLSPRARKPFDFSNFAAAGGSENAKDMESHKMNMLDTLNSIKSRNAEKNT